MALPTIYQLDEIKKVTSTPDFLSALIEGTESGFVQLEKGQFVAAPIQTLLFGGAAQTCVKTGFFQGQDYFVIKVASGGYECGSESEFQCSSGVKM